MKCDKKTYLQLFISTFELSACVFGGGYVIVPLMKSRFVDKLKWIDEREMMDLISISQSSPGPIAVNASLMIGYRIGGIPGALITAFGTVLPALIIISAISFFYTQFRDNGYVSAVMEGMRAGVAAMICNVVINLDSAIIKSKNIVSVLLMLGVFIAVYFYKVNILWVILFCGLTGFISGSVKSARKRNEEGKKATAES